MSLEGSMFLVFKQHHGTVVRGLCWLMVVLGAACQGNDPQNLVRRASAGNNGVNQPDPNQFIHPFTAVSHRDAIQKIKTLLTGEIAREEEWTAIANNQQSLQELIASWQKSPLYEEKMLVFLSKAFQQNQSHAQAFAVQGLGLDRNNIQGKEQVKLLKNLHESFARTILALDQMDKPFTTMVNTQEFMMTSALKAYYTCLDDTLVGGSLGQNDPKTRSGSGTGGFGGFLQQLGDNGFTDWQMTRIEQVGPGEPSNLCHALPAAVAASSLRLVRPRIGFFTTPSFLATWQTNVGNQFRVTANQTMIVALGMPFSLASRGIPADVSAIDSKHIQENTPCYGCHVHMDPMRQIFRQVFDINYGVQPNPDWQQAKASFAFAGVTADISGGLPQFADVVANHPLLPKAWILQMCHYATSTSCAADDPEIERIAQVWRDRGYRFSALVQEVFASPLATYLAPTMTAGLRGQTFPVAKQSHLCPLLSHRLKLPYLCVDAQSVPDKQITATQGMRTILSMMPEDTYQRGAVEPLQANDPSMFLFSGMENFCADLSGLVMDRVEPFSSKAPDKTIDAMVQQLMGIPAASQEPWRALLMQHYTQATGKGFKPPEALQSTWMVACMSPAVMGVGF